MPFVSEFLPTIFLNEHIFHVEISHVCRWRSEKSLLLNFAGSFICPILRMQKFSTRRRSRSVRAVRIHGSEWRSGTSEELLKCLFVLTIGLNRLRKRSASSTITFRIHSPLQSNLRWKPALVKGAYYCLTFLKEKHVSGRARTPRIFSTEVPFLLLESIIRWMSNIYLIIIQLTPFL